MSDPYNPTNYQNPYSQPDFSAPNNPGPPVRPQRRRGCTGCAFLFGIIVIFCIIVVFCIVSSIFSSVIGNIQSHPLPIFFQIDIPYGGWGIGVLVGVGFVILFVVLKLLGGWPRNRFARLLLLLPLLLGLGAALLWAFFINPNIGMTRTGFIRTSTVSITTGDTVYFRNPSDGVKQILCVGKDQHCEKEENDPAQLDSGLVVQPGQIVSVTFKEAGTYELTSETTSHMNITISVNEPSDSSD